MNGWYCFFNFLHRISPGKSTSKNIFQFYFIFLILITPHKLNVPRGGGSRRCWGIPKSSKHTDAFRLSTQYKYSRAGRGEETQRKRKQRTLCILFVQLPMQGLHSVLHFTPMNMHGWLLVPQPCGGRVASSTGTQTHSKYVQNRRWKGSRGFTLRSKRHAAPTSRIDAAWAELCWVAAAGLGRVWEGLAGCQLNGC